jgi:hypothetical protein
VAKNGGYRGLNNDTSIFLASGRWGISQAYVGIKNSQWPRTIPFEYVIVAGAGGGGGADNQTEGGGGGGAGGYRTGTVYREISAILTVTVGAGGNGAPTHPTSPQFGSKGGNSVFAGVTSNGGGSGGIARDTVSTLMDGGSGGGAAGRQTRAGFGNTPARDPVQGFDGRDPVPINNNEAGGGGGATGSGSGSIYLGGPGATTLITGTSRTHSIGGQGGRGISTAGYVAGAANSGTGGAGGYGRNSPAGGDQTCQGGQSGGSGIIFIKYPDIFANLLIGPGLVIDNGAGGNVLGGSGFPASPSFTTSGFKIYMFKSGSGTITIE